MTNEILFEMNLVDSSTFILKQRRNLSMFFLNAKMSLDSGEVLKVGLEE